MASLRTRVLASVLLLSTGALVLLAAVTYTEQRSFLQGRVDQQVEQAGPAVSQALDSAGFRPPASSPAHELSRGRSSTGGASTVGEPGGVGGPPHAGPNPPNLPPGTYGQRRDASGKVLGHLLITYGQTAPPEPKIAARVPINKLFTVASVRSSGLTYRAFVSHDPEDSGLTVVALPLREVEQTLSRLLLVEGLVIGIVLLVLGVVAFFLVRVGLRPLDRMGVTAGAIAAGDLSRRVYPATPRTEVGRLGLALNAMLERLERAFAQRQASEDRLRQFLSDASHELRTPLAAIRGYAELFRMGATRDPAATDLAMRRIEEESKRMGVLVEDLLTLARLDEEPEIVRETVDLAGLASDAVVDAHATAPERAISLHAPGPAFVRGDPHQLTQVMANLLRNGLVHTPAGTPIEVSVEQDEDRVTVAVRDHGPGIPESSVGLLFERFWRAEGGRERGKAGAGLGLAIVGEIVDAHGGEVAAQNAPDGGALFVIRLPKAPAPQGVAQARASE